jgi:hypothetical protein
MPTGAEVVRFAVPMRAAVARGKDAAVLVIDHEACHRVDHLHVSQPVVVPDGRDQLPLLGLNGQRDRTEEEDAEERGSQGHGCKVHAFVSAA